MRLTMAAFLLLDRLSEYARILRVLTHCLLCRHPLGRWRDDWMRPRYYCRTCAPRRPLDKLFFAEY